jgi:hypothetical protein
MPAKYCEKWLAMQAAKAAKAAAGPVLSLENRILAQRAERYAAFLALPEAERTRRQKAYWNEIVEARRNIRRPNNNNNETPEEDVHTFDPNVNLPNKKV